jgi:hypothetical protein
MPDIAQPETLEQQRDTHAGFAQDAMVERFASPIK